MVVNHKSRLLREFLALVIGCPLYGEFAVCFNNYYVLFCNLSQRMYFILKETFMEGFISKVSFYFKGVVRSKKIFKNWICRRVKHVNFACFENTTSRKTSLPQHDPESPSPLT